MSKCCGISLCPQEPPAFPSKTACCKAPYEEDPLEDPQVVLDAEEEPTNTASSTLLTSMGAAGLLPDSEKKLQQPWGRNKKEKATTVQ